MPIFPLPVPGVRRGPLLLAALLFCAGVPDPARAQGHGHHGHGAKAQGAAQQRHPHPRRGITAARVLPADSVREQAREVYTIAARVPTLLDGLYCHCDCHERDGLRSLLECFTNAMASTCGICQGEAQMAAEMAEKGRGLRDVRKAVDTRYGS